MHFVHFNLYSFCIFYIFINSVLLVASLSPLQHDATQPICPNFCKCDLYNKRNRAVCSGKRLINPNIDLPVEVEYLDLSYNDITSLDNNCFKKYIFLISLNISHNAIHTIDLFTFKNMRHISFIDLSFNRLEYLDESLFENNRQLTELNLEGNKFMGLSNKPLLRSRSLRTINLRKVQLDYMNTAMFSGLPSLEYLDVSQNLMITINLAAFEYLGRLRIVNMNQNLWNCDEQLMTIVKALRERNIIVTLQDCREDNDDKAGIEFERMELVPSEEDADLEADDVNVNVPTNWRHPNTEDDYDADEYDEDDSNYNIGMMVAPTVDSSLDNCGDVTHTKLCRKYRQCLVNVTHVLEQQHGHDCDEKTASANYTETDVKLAFLLGVAAGVSAAVFWLVVVLCMKICTEGCKKRKQHRVQQHVEAAAVDSPSTSQGNSRPVPPPVPPLRMPKRSRSAAAYQRQQRATHPQAAVARYDAMDDNFISRLFGHQSRHRYYRSINQNTATLIRRLSRSNLFNNRLSQHIVDRELERGRNGGRASDPPSPDEVHNHEAASEVQGFLTTTATVGTVGDETATTAAEHRRERRAETPPPNYGDIMATERSENND